MKKFRFLLALAMVVTMITTLAFAADESLDGYGISVPETVEYTAGSPVTFDFTMTKGLTANYGQINFVYDTEVWTINVDTDMNVADRGNGNTELMYATGGTFTDGQVLATVTATLKDGATADGATFEVTKVDFWGDEDYIYCEGGYKTITVEAASAVTYEDKDIVTRVNADVSDIELADVKYTNVAKYVGTINFDAIKAAFADGEYLNNEAGIMLNGIKKYQFTGISTESEGTVEYSVLFYGITPAQAADVNISTYYNAHVIAE